MKPRAGEFGSVLLVRPRGATLQELPWTVQPQLGSPTAALATRGRCGTRRSCSPLSSGVAVAGAASIGALRSAECSAFGMVGIGKILRRFSAGELADDADV